MSLSEFSRGRAANGAFLRFGAHVLDVRSAPMLENHHFRSCLPKIASAPLKRIAGLAGICLLLAGLSACQVRPLYSDAAPNAAGLTTNAALNSIAVSEAKDRVAQEVRNHLIFALSGGAGEPASPAYVVDLGVSEQLTSVALSNPVAGNTGQPTAGSVALSSLYVLKDSSGKQIASGKRTATASFDRPLQQFSSLRAQRDAENRAARELAEMLKLALAADLAR